MPNKEKRSNKAEEEISIYDMPKSIRNRRTKIMPRPDKGLNLELLKEIFKNLNGRDLFQIPIPCHFNEPLSGLQRLNEEFEYSHLLDKAAKCTNSLEQMKFVAAFVISTYGWQRLLYHLFLFYFILTVFLFARLIYGSY